MYKYIQEEVIQCGHFMVGKSTTNKYHGHIGEVTMILSPHYIIWIGMWFSEKTMDVTSTKPLSNKDIYQYSESTLTAVFIIQRLWNTVIINWDGSSIHIIIVIHKHVYPIYTANIGNDWFIHQPQKHNNNILRKIKYTILNGTTRVT